MNKEILEIFKLKNMLEKEKIPFSFNDHFFQSYPIPTYQIVIYDKRDNNTRLCDVIFHFGSYGYD